MINVIISEIEMELAFDTKIPKIPEIGDKIGAWFNHEWHMCSIQSFVYEFNQDGSFNRVEINVLAT